MQRHHSCTMHVHVRERRPRRRGPLDGACESVCAKAPLFTNVGGQQTSLRTIGTSKEASACGRPLEGLALSGVVRSY